MRKYNSYTITGDLHDVDMCVDVDDILCVLREMSLEDLEYIKKEFSEIIDEFHEEDKIDITKIPNIIAEKEYKDFIEMFRKKWNI